MQVLQRKEAPDRLQRGLQAAEISDGEGKDNTVADIGKLRQAPEAVSAGDKKGPRHFAFTICDGIAAAGFRRQ